MSGTPLGGTLIEGKYEILSKIKEGGMGTIYQVRHRLLDEIRVVKVMLPQLGSEEEYRHRFIQEAKMATRLKHPNVGTIHDFAVDPDGTAYIVMEYIDGVNLAQLLRTSGPPGLALTLEIAHQTLQALGYLHRKSVVHRDVALDNLMLTHDEEDRPQIKLIDLGISKALDKTIELTSRGVFLGKLKYSSPEQLGSLGPDETLDARSDLYSLGVVLYELLTGRAPLGGDSPRTLIGAHLFHPPLPFTESDPEGKVPPELRAAVLKALEKKRTDRFASAEEFDREVLRLREKLVGRVSDSAHKLLSQVRATRDIEPVAVTPSAQDRLDRQFLAHTTPAARPSQAGILPWTDPALEPTVVDPRVATGQGSARSPAELARDREVAGKETASISRPLPSPPPTPRRRLLVPILLASVTVVALLLTFLPERRSAQRPPAPATPVADSGLPAAAAPTAPAESAATSASPELSTTVEPPAEAAPSPAADPPVDSGLRRVAEQSRGRAVAARAAAERAGAPARAETAFGSARRKQRDGEAFLAREEFESAIDAFADAAELYRRAASTALAFRPTPAEVIASAEAPPPPLPSPAPEEAPSPAVEAPRVPTAAPTVRPRPVTSGEEEKIRETIRRYVQAQNTLDADLYARVYPAITGARRQAVESAWRGLQSQQLDVEIRQIRVTDSHAEARVYERRVAVPRAGTEQRDSRERVIRLEKRGDAWVIESLN